MYTFLLQNHYSIYGRRSDKKETEEKSKRRAKRFRGKRTPEKISQRRAQAPEPLHYVNTSLI